MYYQNIYFQYQINYNYYLGHINLDFHNYNIYEYLSKSSDHKLNKQYITKWLKKSLNILEIEVKILLSENDNNKLEDNNIYFSISIDQKKKQIKIENMKEINIDEKEILSEEYIVIKNEINVENNINLNDYNDDELEYVFDESNIYELGKKYYEENYKKYFDKRMSEAKTDDEKYDVEQDFGPLEDKIVYAFIKSYEKMKLKNKIK